MMKFWQKSFESLVENVAADEALLDWAETHDTGPILRVWESPEYGVVIGYGNSPQREVVVSAARASGVSVVRRCSGGGTVVQGPGCFNYAFVLPVDGDPLLGSITGTTQWVMTRMRDLFHSLAMKHHLNPSHPLAQGDECRIEMAGDSDLIVNGLKFSGNAQRRRKRYSLFHGTVLTHMELNRIDVLLAHPSREPGYRAGRSHSQFVTNVGVDQGVLVDAIRNYFNVIPLDQVPDPILISEYVASRYSKDIWADVI